MTQPIPIHRPRADVHVEVIRAVAYLPGPGDPCLDVQLLCVVTDLTEGAVTLRAHAHPQPGETVELDISPAEVRILAIRLLAAADEVDAPTRADDA